MGLRSSLINARADAADVQARGSAFSLVADAKAFRLSRTAKNQKDFKVQAMDGWRSGLGYAMIVCPVYQLPTRTSQIYQQAIARNVCILSYSHLAALVGLALRRGQQSAERGLGAILETVPLLHPSKSPSITGLGSIAPSQKTTTYGRQKRLRLSKRLALPKRVPAILEDGTKQALGLITPTSS